MTEDGDRPTFLRGDYHGISPTCCQRCLENGGQSTTPHWPSGEEFEMESI